MCVHDTGCAWQSDLSNANMANVNVSSESYTLDTDLRDITFYTMTMSTVLSWILLYFKELCHCHFILQK